MSAWLLAAALLAAPARAAPHKRRAPQPLPADAAEDDRVLIDHDAGPVEATEEAPAPGAPGVRHEGQGRVVSVDAKARRLVLELEDGARLRCQVPEKASLTFAADARPLHLDQLRRGDAVAYALDGAKLARLHLELGGAPPSEDESDAFQVARGAPQPRAAPPPPDEEVDAGTTADEPDTPMYQSEPPPAPRAR